MLMLRFLVVLCFFTAVSGPRCGWAVVRTMEVTAYCKCGKCNGYTRGSWKFLKLDQWNRYVNEGPDSGEKYTGKTASGGKLVMPKPGLLSGDTVRRPYMIPLRVLPWNITSRMGAIAADTNYYPFGTKMYVPGWGWGVVTDRGRDIKGPDRIDILYNRHGQANEWGRQRVEVDIRTP
jgi:hypothetical protein